MLFFSTLKIYLFEHIPLPRNYHFAVVNSGKKRALVESGYKQRREECEAAAAFS